MHNLHFHDWLPADRVYLEKKDKYSATLDAVRHAYKLLSQSSSENGLSYQDREIAYYLV
jgi:hypothetical protein